MAPLLGRTPRGEADIQHSRSIGQVARVFQRLLSCVLITSFSGGEMHINESPLILLVSSALESKPSFKTIAAVRLGGRRGPHSAGTLAIMDCNRKQHGSIVPASCGFVLG